MFNKNGFTLVELIATIAILSIIIVIGTPKINDYIEKRKKDLFITNAVNIVRQLEYDNMDYKNFEYSLLSEFNIDKQYLNNFNLNESFVYVKNDEIYLSLVGKDKYEEMYLCDINFGEKNYVVQNTPCKSYSN